MTLGPGIAGIMDHFGFLVINLHSSSKTTSPRISFQMQQQLKSDPCHWVLRNPNLITLVSCATLLVNANKRTQDLVFIVTYISSYIRGAIRMFRILMKKKISFQLLYLIRMGPFYNFFHNKYFNTDGFRPKDTTRIWRTLWWTGPCLGAGVWIWKKGIRWAKLQMGIYYNAVNHRLSKLQSSLGPFARNLKLILKHVLSGFLSHQRLTRGITRTLRGLNIPKITNALQCPKSLLIVRSLYIIKVQNCLKY